MNSISSRSESHSETEISETDDGNGNIVQTETTVTKTTLYITVSHLTVDEMADLYGFDAEQREYLAELLKDENNSIWAAVLYGIRYSDDQIVTVALSQVGNVGGEPVLVLVRLRKPCGMVCLFCKLVRRSVRLYRHRGCAEICGLRERRPVVQRSRTVDRRFCRACPRNDYFL